MSSSSNSNNSTQAHTGLPPVNRMSAAVIEELIGNEQQDHIQQRMIMIKGVASHLAWLVRKLKAMPRPRFPPVFKITHLDQYDEESLDWLRLELECWTVRSDLVAKLMPEEDPFSSLYITDMDLCCLSCHEPTTPSHPPAELFTPSALVAEELDETSRPRVDSPEGECTGASCAFEACEDPCSASILGDEGDMMPNIPPSLREMILAQMLHQVSRSHSRSIDHLRLYMANNLESSQDIDYIRGLQLMESASNVLNNIPNYIGKPNHPEGEPGAEQERRVDKFMQYVWNSS